MDISNLQNYQSSQESYNTTNDGHISDLQSLEEDQLTYNDKHI